MVTVKVQPLFWIFEFRKIVLRWDGKPYSACVEFFLGIYRWKSFDNRSTYAEVIKSSVLFSETQCRLGPLSYRCFMAYHRVSLYAQSDTVLGCLSVCPSQAGIVLKRLSIKSRRFHDNYDNQGIHLFTPSSAINGK